MPDRNPPLGTIGGTFGSGAIAGNTVSGNALGSGHPARLSWSEQDNEAAERAFKRLTREEAAALRARHPSVSPWRVIVVQAVVGLVVALLGGLAAGRLDVMWSALYGAATAVLPGALMARGISNPLSRSSPGTSAVSVMGWELLKIVLSVAMLYSAPRFVQPLSWPALLATLAACLSVYGFALTWRGRAEPNA